MVQRSGVLIETYWNVKTVTRWNKNGTYEVLIETYWNVKTEIPPSIWLYTLVLIETYWNVKKKEGEFV